MPYISADGTVQEKQPWGIDRIVALFFGIFHFIYMFVLTLFNSKANKYGDKYTTDYRSPGSGPPRPPRRRFGGIDHSTPTSIPGGCASCSQNQ